jgi:hypothetical protein
LKLLKLAANWAQHLVAIRIWLTLLAFHMTWVTHHLVTMAKLRLMNLQKTSVALKETPNPFAYLLG